jgi:hypothetical protein
MMNKPIPHSWNWVDAIAEPLDDDFVKAALDQPPSIERPEIEKFFESRSAPFPRALTTAIPQAILISCCRMASNTYHVRADWDPEAAVWIATSGDVPGLATEAETIEGLSNKLRVMIPELLDANSTLSRRE